MKHRLSVGVSFATIALPATAAPVSARVHFLRFQEKNMKSLICFALAAAALTSATASFANTTSAPLTRAEVIADLVRLEQAGYQPAAGDDPHYPDDIQAAEARVAAQAAAQQHGAVQAGR
ncbi:DUF4148 domain-containing protein [Burkholderia theae]|uniref:DUF4148 domain-containing protein n=1 Tax=Burkholderia theae TaxID=3143496 RepID=UPI0039F61F7B